MTPVSSVLSRSAIGLLAGIALATAAVNLAPQVYFDLTEWRLADIVLPGRPEQVVTPALVVSDLLMAAFVFLLGKELWEAMTHESGGFAGRAAAGPWVIALASLLLPMAIWVAVAPTDGSGESGAGWILPLGSDVALAYLFARAILGSGHPTLQLVLFVCVATELAALAAAGVVAPREGGLAPAWLILPVAAALAGYRFLTRRAADPLASEKARARALSPRVWLPLGVVSWLGVAAAGLPPALGFLPILPAMPRARHSFGLFAVAEAFLTDPANRIARALRPMAPTVMFLFGFTHGGMDLAAADRVSAGMVAALWIGKPLGIVLGAWVAAVLFDRPLLRRSDYGVVAALSALSFTAPVLALGTALPGGSTTEAARLGLGIALLAGPLALVVFRRRQ